MTYLPSLLPLLIAFVIISAMYRPLRRLRALGATSAATARPLADIPPGDQRYLRTWLARGVVRESAPGTYWYDAEAAAERQRRELRWVAVILLVLTAGAAAFLWWVRTR